MSYTTVDLTPRIGTEVKCDLETLLDGPLNAGFPSFAPDGKRILYTTLRGGFPEIRLLEDRNRIARYHAYIDSIVERDIAPVLDEIAEPDELFKRQQVGRSEAVDGARSGRHRVNDRRRSP